MFALSQLAGGPGQCKLETQSDGDLFWFVPYHFIFCLRFWEAQTDRLTVVQVKIRNTHVHEILRTLIEDCIFWLVMALRPQNKHWGTCPLVAKNLSSLGIQQHTQLRVSEAGAGHANFMV